MSEISDFRSDTVTRPTERMRQAMAKAVVGAGYDLLELRPVGMSLEEIFLELTRDDGQSRRKER